MTATATAIITEPGVYDIPEAVYHADPVPEGSLSASGAKKILQCPARFDYDRKQPPQPTTAMELGTAVHKLVLGVGADIVVVDADNYRTKDAQGQAASARAAGKIPLLPKEHAEAQAIASAVRRHPLAGALFSNGTPEQSLFWQDAEFGIWCRARLDWLPEPGPWGHRMVIPDLKTTSSADPQGLGRTAGNFGYHIQHAQYLDGVRALGLDAAPAFLFVFVETEPPYLVTVAELDGESAEAGRTACRAAREKFRDCTESGIWPGYSAGDEIRLISMPPWIRGRTYEGLMS